MRISVANKIRYQKIVRWIANLLTPPPGSDSTKWECKNRWLRRADIVIGENVAIGPGFSCLFEGNKNIFIGDHCVLASGLRVWNFNTVTIGEFSTFAADVTLVNGGHDKNSLEPFSAPLVIGRGCWIGNGARIVGGVTIGDNVIVGAGAVVLKDVPDGAIVAGVPARIIGVRDLPAKVWHFGGAWFSPVTFELIDD